MSQKVINDFVYFLSRNAAMTKRKDGKFILRAEKRMTAKLQSVFKKQQKYLLEGLKNFSSLNAYSKNSIPGDIKKLLKNMVGQSELVETIVFYSKTTMLKGGERSVKDLALRNFGISFDIKHPGAVKYFKEKTALELSDYKGTITATTKDRIETIIADAVDRGASYNEVAAEIIAQGDAGVFSRARAEMIASNEAGKAYEQGRKYPIDDFIEKNNDRKVEKSWLTVGDDRVTPTHSDNEAQGWIPYDALFSGTGDSEPPASDNPRCRCTIAYQII